MNEIRRSILADYDAGLVYSFFVLDGTEYLVKLFSFTRAWWEQATLSDLLRVAVR